MSTIELKTLNVLGSENVYEICDEQARNCLGATYTAESSSGNIISFNSESVHEIGVITTLEASEEGITEIDLHKFGSNIFPTSELTMVKSSNRTANLYFDTPLPPGTYTISGTNSGTATVIRGSFYASDNTKIDIPNQNLTGDFSRTLTTTFWTERIYFYIGSAMAADDTAVFSNLRINYGSADLGYEEYEHSKYSVDISSLTSGGTYNWGTGVLSDGTSHMPILIRPKVGTNVFISPTGSSTITYYSFNDFNSAIPTGKYIGGNIYETLELFNEIFSSTFFVTPEYYGAVADGIIDDTLAVQYIINDIANGKKATFPPNRTYAVSQVTIPPLCSVDFNGCTLKRCSTTATPATDAVVLPDVTTNTPNGTISNLIIDCNFIATYGLYVSNASRRNYENITINNVTDGGIGLYVLGTSVGNLFNNFKGDGGVVRDGTAIESTFIQVDRGDNTFSNIDYRQYKYGINNNAFTIYSNVHGYIATDNIYQGSYFMKVSRSLQANNLYPDTQQYMFLLDYEFTAKGMLDDVAIIFSSGQLTETDITAEGYVPYAFYLEDGITGVGLIVDNLINHATSAVTLVNNESNSITFK